MTEQERKAIVEATDDHPVWLADGRKARFVGWVDPWRCGISSGQPGFWTCSWETAAQVLARLTRRFTPSDAIRRTDGGWLGLVGTRDDYQTEEDYQAALVRGDV